MNFLHSKSESSIQCQTVRVESDHNVMKENDDGRYSSDNVSNDTVGNIHPTGINPELIETQQNLLTFFTLFSTKILLSC